MTKEETKQPNDEPQECHCCGYRAKNLKTYDPAPFKNDVVLCRFCASTFLSHAIIYPMQLNLCEIAKAIGWIANHLDAKLDALLKERGAEHD